MAPNNNRNAVAAYTSSDVMIPDGFDENVDLIIQTYAKDLTPQEMSLFAADAHQRGLSIVKRQIYATKYNGKMTIMVGIDGYRSQAESHPDYAGQDGPYWCGEDGIWRDVWLSPNPPMAAKVGIYRKGFQAPVTGVVLWSEYYNQNNPSWKKFPTVMLAKCAEAQAIRKAFPSKLGGTYISEEMDQAGAVETTARVVDQSTGELAAPKPTTQKTPKRAAIDRIHAVANKHGLDHDDIHNMIVALGGTSTNKADPTDLHTLADRIEANPEKAQEWAASLRPQNAPESPQSDEAPEPESVPANGELNFSEEIIPTPSGLADRYTHN